MKNTTVYEVKYFNVFTDTSYTVTTNNSAILKQFMAQLNSHTCILMLDGNTATIREYVVDDYYPDDTTLSLYMSEVDDTYLYLSQYMMEQAYEIIHGDIAYFASQLPDIVRRKIVPFCRGTFESKLIFLINTMLKKVIVDSKDSCVDVIKGICSLELFFTNVDQMSEYLFDSGEED